MKKSRFRILKNKWVIALIIVVLIIGAVIYAQTRTKAPNFQFTSAAIGTVVEQVSVTGTVSPIDKASLAFEKGGVISKIYVNVGDLVTAGEPIASLDSSNDTAALASAQATLADMSRNLTPEELAVETTALVNANHAAYVGAQAALVNYTDSFFSSPQSPNPTLKIPADSQDIVYRLQNERVGVTTALDRWSTELAMDDGNAPKEASAAIGFLTTIKSFMNDLAASVNDLNQGNSGLSGQQIAAYVSAMNSGLSNLNSAMNSVTTAQSEYNLKLSGNSSQSIAAQAAKVAQAQASLAEDTITSPIDGVVTQEDPNVGEYMAPGQGGFAVQNSGFKIEAYVPEADIAKVAVGDLASSTLDAYGAYVDFPAKVIMIDPAETVLEGVPTYKVTLQFVSPDSRIRSGMTDNLEILTHEARDVVEIPYRAVMVTATSTTVRVVSADGKSYKPVPVVVGLKGSDGTVEVVSGLSVGDKVVTYTAGE